MITRSEESYRVCCILCGLEISNMRRSRPDLGCWVTEEKKYSKEVWKQSIFP